MNEITILSNGGGVKMLYKVWKLPKCNNAIVIPIRHSGGGYECVGILSEGEINAERCYIHELGFEDAIDLTGAIKTL